MASGKMETQKGVTQRHLHSRISYLYQAATYLATTIRQSQVRTPGISEESGQRSDSRGELQSAVVTSKAASENGLPFIKGSRMAQIERDSDSRSKDFALSRQLITHLRATSLRSQIRLSPAVKHTVCKRCDILLVPGSTSTSYMENRSRGARKPWADVLVTTCTACGISKRFPVGGKRQFRRASRNGKTQIMAKQRYRAIENENSS